MVSTKPYAFFKYAIKPQRVEYMGKYENMFNTFLAFVDLPELMTHLRNSYDYWKEQDRIPSPTDLQQLLDVEETIMEKDECSTEDENGQVGSH